MMKSMCNMERWQWKQVLASWKHTRQPHVLPAPAARRSLLELAEHDAAVVAAKAKGVGQHHALAVPRLLLLANHHAQVNRLLRVVQVEVGVQVACSGCWRRGAAGSLWACTTQLSGQNGETIKFQRKTWLGNEHRGKSGRIGGAWWLRQRRHAQSRRVGASTQQ